MNFSLKFSLKFSAIYSTPIFLFPFCFSVLNLLAGEVLAKCWRSAGEVLDSSIVVSMFDCIVLFKTTTVPYHSSTIEILQKTDRERKREKEKEQSKEGMIIINCEGLEPSPKIG